MSPRSTNLDQLVTQVKARIRARKVSKGVALTLCAVVIWTIAASLVASHVRSGWPLTLLRFSPLVAGLIAAWFFFVRPLRAKLESARLARLIEEKCALNDRLVTAVEYSDDPHSASPAIVDRLIDDTAGRIVRVSPDQVVDPKYAYGYSGASILILLVGVLSFFLGPDAVTRGVNTLYGIGGDTVAANAMFISVTPGTTRVPRGSDVKIKAGLNGFDSALAQMFTQKRGADTWSGVVMEPAKNAGEFQTVLFNIQDSVAYYVEANGIRSPEFNLEVADLPFVKQLDLVLKFPAYTRLPEKKIENGGEIAALKGTVVQVFAHMTGAARSARIVLNDGTKIDMTAGPDNQFIGQFAVKESGTYKIEVISDDGAPYNGSNEYDIEVLEDHPPTVVIDKPGRDLKVTNIQEVFTEARAEDDFGVSSIEIHYSLNGGEEKIAKLQDLKSDTPKSLSGAHTFFLEEYGLKPGDFISYYATARDNSEGAGRQSTSDIYFMEVRPFDREFRQAQQQNAPGEGDQDQSTLSRRQRDIIAATFRVQRELESYSRQEKDENFGAVALSQEKLKSDADALAERIRRRFGEQLAAQPDYAKLVEYVTLATKEMDPAITALRAQNTKDAMPPEQRALQQLLRAEAIFREIQVARGNSQGGSGQNDQENLADLFELQLDKMKNQYETVQREQRANQSQQQDEIARKLKELAQRQQKQLEQQMRSQAQQGGGEGGSQRQQQEMIDEAQKMARELERLSRDRRDPKLEEAARQMQQAADDMRRAQAAQGRPQNSSSQSSNNDSTSQQLRAMERMEQARRLLESSERAGGQQSVSRLRQEAEDALRRQQEIARDVDDLVKNQQQGGQSGAAAQQKKEQIGERKEQLAEQLSGLERDIDQTARGLGQERQQAGDKLREAANAIRNNRIPDRIRANQQLIENGWMDQARERESIVKQNIEQVVKTLQAAEGSASRRSEGESLEEALNRARELADSLESLRRRMESQQGQQQGEQQAQNRQQSNQGQQQGQQGQQQGQQGQQQGQQAQSGRQGQSSQQARQQGQSGQQARENRQGRQRGQQQAQQQGQQAQNGQQSGQQRGQQQGEQQGQQSQSGQQGQQAGSQSQSGQQPGGQSSQGNQPSSAQSERANEAGGGPPRSGDRQLESELRQRVTEAEELRRQLGRNSDLARDLNRVIDQLRRINPNVFNDAAQLAALKNDVIDPLRQLEIELARRLQAKLGNPGAGTFGDGEAPDRYRKMIEDYYRRLSSRSSAPRQ